MSDDFQVGDRVRFQSQPAISIVIEVDAVGLSLYVPDGQDYSIYDDVLASEVTLVERAYYAPPGEAMWKAFPEYEREMNRTIDELVAAKASIERVRELCRSENVAPETDFIRFVDGTYDTNVDVVRVSDVIAAIRPPSESTPDPSP